MSPYDVPMQDYVDKLIESVASQVGQVRSEIAAARAESAADHATVAVSLESLRRDIEGLKVQDATATTPVEVQQIARIEAAKVLDESKSSWWTRLGVAAGVAGGVAGLVTAVAVFLV